MATTPYDIINGVYLSNRAYMNITGCFVDWCCLNKINDEDVTKEDIAKFIKDTKHLFNEKEDVVRAALRKYYRYFNKEYLLDF